MDDLSGAVKVRLPNLRSVTVLRVVEVRHYEPAADPSVRGRVVCSYFDLDGRYLCERDESPPIEHFLQRSPWDREAQ